MPWRLPASALCACLLAGTWAAPASGASRLPTPGPGAGQRIVIVDATPRPHSSDGRSRDGTWRITATPNRDGSNDRVLVRACAPAGVRLQLRGWVQRREWWNDIVTKPTGPLALQPRRLPAACRRGARLYELEWTGARLQGGSLRNDSTIMRVCVNAGMRALAPDISQCAAPTVIANVTTINARLNTTSSVRPGGALAFEYWADSRRPLAAAVVRDTREGIREAVDAPLLIPGTTGRTSRRTSILVPADLRSGRYRLAIYNTGTLARAVSIPFVVRSADFAVASPPARAALIVWPTNAWSAYERYDADHDGAPESWYHNNGQNVTVPLMNWHHGLEAGARLDLASSNHFTAWLQSDPSHVYTSVTSLDFANMSSAELGRYEAVWFPGHDEYYELRAWQKLLQYRDSGGDINFLSANNFARRVAIDPVAGTITNLDYYEQTFREYVLTGIGIRACGVNFNAGHQMSAVVGPASADLGWLFEGTDVASSSPVAHVAYEIDGLDPVHSPAGLGIAAQSETLPSGTGSLHRCKRSTTVAAMVASRFGSGGGTVFSSGNMTFLRTQDPLVSGPAEIARTNTILANLWRATVLEEGRGVDGGPIVPPPTTVIGTEVGSGTRQAAAAQRSATQRSIAARAALRVPRSMPTLRAAGGRAVRFPRLRSDADGLVRYGQAAARLRGRAARAAGVSLSEAGRDALAELIDLQRGTTPFWTHMDADPALRHEGIEPDPYVILWRELTRGS